MLIAGASLLHHLAADNPNLDFVLLDTVQLVEQLRGEGRSVLVHCVQAERRTPAVAALYGARNQGVAVTQAFRESVQSCRMLGSTRRFTMRCNAFTPRGDRGPGILVLWNLCFISRGTSGG